MIEKNINICPLCNSTNNRVVYNINFTTLQCEDCQLYFHKDYYTKEELFNFYNISYGITRGKRANIKKPEKELFDINKYEWLKERNLRLRFIPVIDSFSTKKNILEIGADAGGATRYMIEKGHNVEAIELFKDYADKLMEEGITVYNDLFENINFNKKYDIIVALEVIEHFSDPLKCINKIYDLLNDGGYFIFETPVAKDGLVDSASYSIRPAHYCVFNPTSLKILLKDFKDLPKFNEGNEVYKIRK